MPKKAKSKFVWNQVTPLSKYLAMILFIALPFIAFIMGMRFQAELDELATPTGIVNQLPR